MEGKTCGDCKYYNDAMFHCEKFVCLTEDSWYCPDFDEKIKPKPTNGDVILQGGNRALAQFAYASLRICRMCIFSQLEEGRYECTAERGKSCIDGIEAWLNALAESQLNDAIQNVIKDGAKTAIDIHEDAYAPDMNDGTKESEVEDE